MTTGDPPALHKVTAASCATAEEAAAARGYRKCRPPAPPCPRPRGGHFRSWGITAEFRVQIVWLRRRPSMCVEDARGYSW